MFNRLARAKVVNGESKHQFVGLDRRHAQHVNIAALAQSGSHSSEVIAGFPTGLSRVGGGIIRVCGWFGGPELRRTRRRVR